MLGEHGDGRNAEEVFQFLQETGVALSPLRASSLPTGGRPLRWSMTMVDPIMARRLGGLIQRLKQQLGFTSIVVTHEMSFAQRLADTVLFLDTIKGEQHFLGPSKSSWPHLIPNIQQFLTLDALMRQLRHKKLMTL